MRFPAICNTEIPRTGAAGLVRQSGIRILLAAAVMAAVIFRPVFAAVPAGDLYTYERMEGDLRGLAEEYGDICELASLGQTMDGREIWCFRIGQENAADNILITASIHGREYLTTQLVMEQAKAFLASLRNDSVPYRGQTYREMMKDTAIWLIPMVNPDGVTVSQLGTAGLWRDETKQSVYHIYEMDQVIEIVPYLKRWKANAEGVDLNRNFDALWEEYGGPGHPSSDRYKGEFPGCCPESRALKELTEKIRFDRTVSYHTQGEVIYWYFGQTGELLERTESFAEQISRVTGYRMDPGMEALDPAGYKDWAISKMGIPSLTIEVGTETSPVPYEQFGRILGQNRYVWEETVLSCRDRQ